MSDPVTLDALASGTPFAHGGELAALTTGQRSAILDRELDGTDVGPRVREIIERVRRGGDRALLALARELDGVALESLEVSAAAIDAGLEAISDEQREALQSAAEAIAAVHRAQLPQAVESEPRPGVRVGRYPRPLSRIGAYAPGGRAAYPSSVLMCAVPAKTAGVDEVIVCSPPASDGLPAAAVRAACRIAGVDRLFAVGGAGAIAAMALGTDSIDAVDKVVGPGNAWVAQAKLALAHEVAIDLPAGPSELLVIADDEADADMVAAEVLAQAEHDPRAAICVLVASASLAERVAAAVSTALDAGPDADVARTALGSRGALLVYDDLEDACVFSDAYAPEHALVLTAEAGAVARRLRHAGCVFAGPHSSVAFGDYASGGNHVLPTGGRARAWSGLGSADFVRWVGIQEIDARGAAALAGVTATLAEMEGLAGHAAAARRHLGPTGAPTPTGAPLPRAHLRQGRPYAPGRRDAAVEISDNTNLFGVAPAARRELAALDAELLRRYPSVYGDRLTAALAADLGVAPERIATGCGSDDLLDATLRAFVEPGATVAYCVPTFSMIAAFARTNAARCRAVPATAELTPDLEALAHPGDAVTYVCSPDNPSGALTDTAELQRLAERCGGLLLVDEAYVEFAEQPSMAAWAAGSRNVVVLRTFSKVAGLAGLRIGYAVGPPALVGAIELTRGPYKLNGIAEHLATAVLKDDGAWRADVVRRVVANRTRLREEMQRRDLHTWPSAANFVLVRVPERAGGAEALARRLRARSVGVRPFPALPGAGDCIRVSIGPWAMMEAFLAALDGALEETVR